MNEGGSAFSWESCCLLPVSHASPFAFCPGLSPVPLAQRFYLGLYSETCPTPPHALQDPSIFSCGAHTPPPTPHPCPPTFPCSQAAAAGPSHSPANQTPLSCHIWSALQIASPERPAQHLYKNMSTLRSQAPVPKRLVIASSASPASPRGLPGGLEWRKKTQMAGEGGAFMIIAE